MWAFHVSDTHVGRITTETGNGCLLKTPPTVWTPPVWGDGGGNATPCRRNRRDGPFQFHVPKR